MDKVKLPLAILGIFLCIPLIAFGITEFVISGQFDNNCVDYLERAESAGTVEIAVEELNIAIEYLEENEVVEGHTSVFYTAPEDDIGFWYNNLVASRDELVELADSPTTTRTDALMKLRNTLRGRNGIKHPTGISRFPNNGYFTIVLFIMLAMVVAAIIIFIKIG